MHILFRAIITGFGLRLGSEVARAVSKKVRGEGEDTEDDKADKKAEDDDLGSITPDPPQV
jgi:hypothetical protein